jgi:hypothetical protein
MADCHIKDKYYCIGKAEAMRRRNIMISVLGAVFLLFAATSSFGATITLPQTGQGLCFDTSGYEIDCSGSGQDGEHKKGSAWPYPRFTVSGDCVTDNLTGLMWSKDANLYGMRYWEEALSDTNSLSLCGYTDWRLPNINELKSLAHSGYMQESCGAEACDRLSDWLNYIGFINVQPTNFYWSSTTSSDFLHSAMVTDFWDGGISVGVKSMLKEYVWPVRGSSINVWKTGQTMCHDSSGNEIECSGTGQDGESKRGIAWPDPRFAVSGDCVTDNLTGLIWTKDTNLFGNVTWQSALDAANGLSLCGYSDWRLPNRIEMLSLNDMSQAEPGLPDGHPFTNVETRFYWTSTTSNNLTSAAWYRSYFAESSYLEKSLEQSPNSIFSAWPVRGGVSGVACNKKAVRIYGATTGYASLQSAYNVVSTGKTIQSRELILSENPVFEGDKIIKIRGGYDCDFEEKTGYTTINGSLTIGGSGTITVENLIVRSY